MCAAPLRFAPLLICPPRRAAYAERAARARALSRRARRAAQAEAEAHAEAEGERAEAVRSGGAQVMRAHRTRVPCVGVAEHAFY